MPDAIAPYNFVPMPPRIVEGQPVPCADRYHADRFTGSFEIEITTITPTYTRAADCLDPIAEHNGKPADFFHRGDSARTPVMPGSSLRGMFRSVFEILTMSRMEFVSDRRLFYRSFADSNKTGLKQLYSNNFKTNKLIAGILIQTHTGLALSVSHNSTNSKGFVVVHANEIDYEMFAKRNQTMNVTVQISNIIHTYIPVPIAGIAEDGEPGKLIIPGPDIKTRKWYQVILQPKTDDFVFEVPGKVYKDYEARGTMAHGPKFLDTIARSNDLPRYLRVGEPAFAVLDNDNNIIAIGANMMMPFRYAFSISDIARRVPGNDVIEYPDDVLDMTQSVFGTVQDTKQIKSRVFVEDAVCSTTNPWLDKNRGLRYPNILSGPKPTSFQTYLTARSVPQLAGKLPARVNWSESTAVLRGYKRYWTRSNDAALKAVHTEKPQNRKNKTVSDTQITLIRIIRSGIQFSGRIYFEHLTSVELGALYASIQLPNGFTHRMGMAKNLGMGVVSIQIMNTNLFDLHERYRAFKTRSGSSSDTDDILKNAYIAFCKKVAPRKNSLWENERNKAFAGLMFNFSTISDKAQEEIDDNSGQIAIEGTSYDTNEEQWNERTLLPHALSILPEKIEIKDVFELDQSQNSRTSNSTSQSDKWDIGEEIDAEICETGFSGLIRFPNNTKLRIKYGQPFEKKDKIRVRIEDIDTNGKITKVTLI